LFSVLLPAVLLVLIGFTGWTKYRARKELFRENIVSYEGSLWTRNDNLGDINWPKADQYCKTLTLAGLSGWELPTIGELADLYDPLNSTANKIRKPFRLTGFLVWSSTKKDPGSAWGFVFYTGERVFGDMGTSNADRAFCVRRSGK
jgi:hypothetical protein